MLAVILIESVVKEYKSIYMIDLRWDTKYPPLQEISLGPRMKKQNGGIANQLRW